MIISAKNLLTVYEFHIYELLKILPRSINDHQCKTLNNLLLSEEEKPTRRSVRSSSRTSVKEKLKGKQFPTANCTTYLG